jgi:1,2-diacylglycerol 3-alpha-glucosyltransferase/glucuronosyltransferase
MRIAIATDAWPPQVNGVVTTLSRTCDELRRMGHDVLMITPTGRRTIPCPSYPEIRLSLLPRRQVARELQAFAPDCIHIATEGPLGMATRRYCRSRQLPFTTSYHTRFPEYVRARIPLPLSWTYAWLRHYHRHSSAVLVPTPAVRKQLLQRGFRNVQVWTRGVDTAVFNAAAPRDCDLPRPIWINVGRVSVEKNIEAFLNLKLPGSKLIVGDGPDLERLRKRYPDCHFAGYRFGKELASWLAAADVFVFPSRTDTFGLVMLEAMACGLAVAAFPVTGPVDVVEHGVTGALDHDLASACRRALTLGREACIEHARQHDWQSATRQFADYLAPFTTAALSARRAHS